MFQYAAGLALAQQHEVELRFDLEWFDAFQLHQGLELRRVFGLDIPAASNAEMRRVLGWLTVSRVRRIFSRSSLQMVRPSSLAVEPHFHYWAGFRDLPADCYIDGYWQSERYFSLVAERVREAFRFVEPLEPENEELIQEMSCVESVSLHVRRGDYVRNRNVGQVHGVDLTDYYRKAVEKIGHRIQNPHYYIFSDEPDWVRENLSLSSPFTIVEHNRGVDSYRDMQLMTHCKHYILANSSFSWWGGWLGRRQSSCIIAPGSWFNRADIDCSDIYFEGTERV
jgi:hypothetical protein